MKQFIKRLIVQSLALLLVAYLLPGITVTGVVPLVVSALLLGFVNAFIRPIILFFTFPVTILTLGLFVLIINGLCLGLVAWLVNGFMVNGLLSAVIGSILLSIVSFFLNWFFVSSSEKN